jgi:hypothetical protein
MARLGAAALAVDGTEDAARRISEISDEGESAGLTSIQSYAHLILCLNAEFSTAPEATQRARTDLAGHLTDGDFRWLLEIAGFWSQDGRDGGEGSSSPADWIDGVSATHDRWRTILTDRRGRHDPAQP